MFRFVQRISNVLRLHTGQQHAPAKKLSNELDSETVARTFAGFNFTLALCACVCVRSVSFTWSTRKVLIRYQEEDLHDRIRKREEDEMLMRINVVDFGASTPSEPSQSNLLSKCPVVPKIASYFNVFMWSK